MAHIEKTFGNSPLAPYSVAKSDVPGSTASRDVEIADPAGNRAQRRAAKRLGLTKDSCGEGR